MSMDRLEFESSEELKEYLTSSNNLTGAAFQSIDLTSVKDELQDATLVDNILLGCETDASTIQLFQNPVIFPKLPGLPFNPFRSQLYSAEELLGDYKIGRPGSDQQTLDGKIYKHYTDSGKANAADIAVTLARRLHDHAISDALQETTCERLTQGIQIILRGHLIG